MHTMALLYSKKLLEESKINFKDNVKTAKVWPFAQYCKFYIPQFLLYITGEHVDIYQIYLLINDKLDMC